ncbi:uncharacterized protein LOC126683059 isoform X2 [Mercurialis annua]|uniref:uncharacterized protein LOC126683059 isoform X2 n=1 Tax=Mercurialis annua TaxID=3986 RepID=UPI0024AD66F3|nr:uncharacterized protein LOC126683059 isoform X2 [Mercurialis annua]
MVKCFPPTNPYGTRDEQNHLPIDLTDRTNEFRSVWFGNKCQSPQSLGSKHGFQMESKQGVNEEEYSKGLSKIGSSPPSCEHKCYGCNPCEAIQVPTISKTHNHFGVNYANYEPEGWKCKCGPIFYSP